MVETLTFHTQSHMTRQSPPGALKMRNFRLLWLGMSISLLGDQFYLIALPWLVGSIHLQQPDLVINAIQAIVEKTWAAQVLEIK